MNVETTGSVIKHLANMHLNEILEQPGYCETYKELIQLVVYISQSTCKTCYKTTLMQIDIKIELKISN